VLEWEDEDEEEEEEEEEEDAEEEDEEEEEVRGVYDIEPPEVLVVEEQARPVIQRRDLVKGSPSFRMHRRWASVLPSLDAIEEDNVLTRSKQSSISVAKTEAMTADEESPLIGRKITI
jgi:hypothetical protein